MRIKAKSIKHLQRKVSNYKNEEVIKYLNFRRYVCDSSKESMIKIQNELNREKRKVIIDTESEKISRLGSYYIWEAYIRVKIVDGVTGEEV